MDSASKPSIKAGTPPGTLIHIGSDVNSKVEIRVFIYNDGHFSENKYSSVSDVPTLPPAGQIIWVDVDGNHDETIMKQLGQKFSIHELVLSDAMSDEQRTKLDILDNALFWVLKMVYPDKDSQNIVIEQVSFYLKANILITFQEKREDVFEPIRNRIRQCKGRVRKSGADYLFYALADVIVDNYIIVLERIADRTETLEESIMANPKVSTLESVYDLKRELLFLRKSIFPLKEIVTKLQKEETGLITDQTQIYLKDLYDHVVQVNESIETYREMLASLIDMYMMLNSNAMNQVVKTLTIISTIFIPLTFIVGVYGMNFDNMPELRWHYGYFIICGIMVVMAILMLLYFRKKKWF